MTVNFEFLGEEPIENVITCLNYKVDKVVYFGYREVIQEYKGRTENFVKKYCDVHQVVFHPLSHNNLQSVLKTMKGEIEYEIGQGSDIYFDITGGESLILVAFGMLSEKYKTSMHIYNVPQGKLIELNEGINKCISKSVEKKSVRLTLDMLIEMQGGIIDYNRKKEIKGSLSEDFENDVNRIWDVAKKYQNLWNPFSDFIRSNLAPDDNLIVGGNAGRIAGKLSSSNGSLRSIRELNEIIDDLGEVGVLQNIVHSDGVYSFKFKNDDVKKCLWEGGSILELHTYQLERANSDECQVGVHLDWDGIIHNRPGVDVLNEIDVLSLKGYVPTFISCKSGKMDSPQILHALYELDTVANRFGGKYAKKVLVTTAEIKGVYKERAEEMEIETRQI